MTVLEIALHITRLHYEDRKRHGVAVARSNTRSFAWYLPLLFSLLCTSIIRNPNLPLSKANNAHPDHPFQIFPDQLSAVFRLHGGPCDRGPQNAGAPSAPEGGDRWRIEADRCRRR